ncbi:MAG: DUF6664 family protein [Anaerostipes sp.]
MGKKNELHSSASGRNRYRRVITQLKRCILLNVEIQSVYFRGCYDSVGCLKKAGIL